MADRGPTARYHSGASSAQWLTGFFDSVHVDHPNRGSSKTATLPVSTATIGWEWLWAAPPPTAGDIKLGWHMMMNEGCRPERTFLLKGKQPYAAEDAEQIIQTVLKTHTTPVLVHPTYPSPWSRPWKDRAAASPTIYS